MHMMTSTSLQIITAFKDETYANGRLKLKDQDRKLIQRFIDFNPGVDTLDTKDYTRLNKILTQAIKRGSELTGLALMTKIQITAIERHSEVALTSYSELGSFGKRAFTQLEPDKYTQYLFDQATPGELESISNLRGRLEEIQPVVEKFLAMKERVTRNGSLPKAVLKKAELMAFKSGFSPKLKEALMAIKLRWQGVMTENFKRYYTSWVNNVTAEINRFTSSPDMATIDERIKMSSLTQRGVAVKVAEGNYRPANAGEILALAERDSQEEADSFFDKLLFKLNGVISERHEFQEASERWNKATPFESSFNLNFDGGFSFTLHTQIVQNFSVYGKPFHLGQFSKLRRVVT